MFWVNFMKQQTWSVVFKIYKLVDYNFFTGLVLCIFFLNFTKEPLTIETVNFKEMDA